jgi:mono/diheme cytochrome c family protein
MTRFLRVFLALLSLAVLACTLLPSAEAQAGAETIYKAQCANCHGADGAAKTTAGKKMNIGDLRDEQVQKQSDKELYSSIAHGVRHKQYPHAFLHRGLSDAQINKLVAYIRELPKAK